MALALFVSLGFWQLDRAAEKEAMQALFSNEAPYRELGRIGETVPFERVEARGRLLADTQVLIDNIVRNGRLGYFVITPLEVSPGEPLLLVNRGWAEKLSVENESALLEVSDERGPIRGRVGNLPRVGIRGGGAFESSGSGWPKVAVYPTPEEVAAELGREVLPWLLLLSPDDPRGFYRDWQPDQSGPMMHYGYAFQWFAMAAAVVVIAGWQLRKRSRHRD